MIRVKYTWFGILFGATFPCIATAIDIWVRDFPFTLASVWVIQASQPLHWIINSAPLFLGIFAWAAGKRQATAVSLNARLEQKLIDLKATSRALTSEMEERARLEARLKGSQKLESLGRLAGGVAHDFNNLLTVISGYVSILISEQQSAAETRAGLEEIRKATDRAAALTQQLLAYSRNQAAEPVNVDLIQEVEGAQKMLLQLLGEDHTLRVADPGQPCAIRIDRNQFGQVLVNLVVNARDAMPGGGIVEVEITQVSLNEDSCLSLIDAYHGDFVRLSIRDWGCGMDAETRTHIFDPFFSTKGPDGGTGLGLSMVYGIVRQNQGFIDVHSELGSGSAFEVYFPRIDGTPEERVAAPIHLDHQGRETILLVEDEPQIRQLAHKSLSRIGYNVLSFISAEEALAGWPDAREKVQILVTDVVLPGMNGKQLAVKLLNDRPELPVIYISGYGANLISQYGLLAEEIEFIQKPFTPSELISHVRFALDASLT